jgi:hypothetical protein
MTPILIKPGQKFTNVGIAFIVLGLVIFACHHSARSLAPEAFEKAYPSCDTQPNLSSTSPVTLTLYSHCWSRAINNTVTWQSPESADAKYAVRCADGRVINYPLRESPTCEYPIRYRSRDNTMKITLSFDRK